MNNIDIMKKLYKIIQKKQNNNKRELLEPLTTMFRISSLTFMEEKTKIRIHKNKIILQEPYILQGLERWYNGDKSTDVHNLYSPLKYFIIWKKDNYDNKNLDYLIKTTIEGLNIIKKLYEKNDIIQQVLHHYIIMLKNPEDIYDEEKDKSANLFYKKIEKMWTENDIQISVDLLIKIKSTTSKDEKNILKNLYIHF